MGSGESKAYRINWIRIAFHINPAGKSFFNHGWTRMKMVGRAPHPTLSPPAARARRGRNVPRVLSMVCAGGGAVVAGNWVGLGSLWAHWRGLTWGE